MKDYFSTSTPGNATVGATSTTVLAANTARKYLLLCNDSDEDIYVSFGAAAVLNKGLRLNAGGGIFEMVMGDMQFTGIVYAISTSGSKNLSYIEA